MNSQRCVARGRMARARQHGKESHNERTTHNKKKISMENGENLSIDKNTSLGCISLAVQCGGKGEPFFQIDRCSANAHFWHPGKWQIALGWTCNFIQKLFHEIGYNEITIKLLHTALQDIILFTFIHDNASGQMLSSVFHSWCRRAFLCAPFLPFFTLNLCLRWLILTRVMQCNEKITNRCITITM